MNVQLANLSTDLRRVSNWIYEGKRGFVKEYLAKIEKKYKIFEKVGPFEDVWEVMNKIKQGKGGRIRSADRATTLASILLQEALKG